MLKKGDKCKFSEIVLMLAEFVPAPVAPQMFGNAGLEHMEKYGTTKEQIARIAEKNHRSLIVFCVSEMLKI
jgi:acetyl-CoA acetyltransferase